MFGQLRNNQRPAQVCPEAPLLKTPKAAKKGLKIISCWMDFSLAAWLELQSQQVQTGEE